jgi:hypothetical protein
MTGIAAAALLREVQRRQYGGGDSAVAAAVQRRWQHGGSSVAAAAAWPQPWGWVGSSGRYQSKTICEHKNVSYEAHLCPIIVKVQRAPSAQEKLQIVDRHYEELKYSRPNSQTLKKAF